MQKVLIIFIVLNAKICLGQSISEKAISVFSKETLITNAASNPLFIQNKIFTGPYSVDSIDFGTAIYFDIFNNNGQVGIIRTLGTSKEPEPDYQITAYTTNDTMFLKKIDKIIYEQDSGKVKSKRISIFSSMDSIKVLRFIEKHNQKYHSAFTLDDFLDWPSQFVSFGFLCGGYVPDITEDAYNLARLVKGNDSTILKMLASSFSPHDRAYGSVGLFFLQLRGKKLSQELIELVNLNQQSKIKISTCSGCIIDREPLSYVLEELKLRIMYKLLVDYDLL